MMGSTQRSPLPMIALVIALVTLTALAAVPSLALNIYHDPDPVVARGDDSFTVEWTTDDYAISTVSYGLSVPPDSQTQNNSFVKAHKLKVENLQPGKDYYFSILSISENGQAKMDDNLGRYYKTTTRPRIDRTAPVVSNISVDVTDQTQAVVTWLTDEPATSLVYYGEREPTEIQEDTLPVKEHSITISTVPNTQYVLVVGGCDADENCRNATRSGFVSGTGLVPLNVSVPEFTKGNTLDIQGTTIPSAEVRVIINNVPARAMKAGPDGSFGFKDVSFTGSQVELILRVRDASGQERDATFTVTSDSKPPALTLSKELPSYSGEPQLVISGKVDEQSTITYGVSTQTVAPARVTGLKSTRATANSITLVWDPITDITRYAIYRNNVRVGVVTGTTFVDSVSAGELYTYRVSAVTTDCVEGPYSETARVSSEAAGLKLTLPAGEVALGCGESRQSIEAKGAFTLTLTLKDGPNDVLIQARDRAGNVAFIKGVVIVDTKPPAFENNNLNELSPSYTRSVTVRGKLNKQGTVFIYINDNKPITTLTDSDGTFSKQVDLDREMSLRTTKGASTTIVGELSEGWENAISIEGVDLAGRKVRIGPVPVLYSICGFGSDFAVNLGKPLPDVLIPRLLLEGVQESGFWVNVSYRGRMLERPPRIAVSLLPVSSDKAKDYDNDWITRPSLLQNPRKPGEGYVQFLFSPPVERSKANADGTAPKGTSSLEAELSKHRLGKCKVPGFGCVRLLVAIDITADERLPKTISDPRVQGSPENFLIRKLQQRTCVDMELQIDRSLELSKNIPHKFLDVSIKTIDAVLDGINQVLDPLITVGTYTTYGCMAMNGVLYGMFFSEHMSCDYATVEGQGVVALLDKWIGGRDTMRDIAEIGTCEQVFKGVGIATTDQEKLGAYTACKKCSDAIARRKTLESQMRTVCDRVACPSAPTLQTYIKDKQKQGVRPVQVMGFDSSLVHNNVNGVLYAGSSCGFAGQGGQTLSVGYSSAAAPATYSLNTIANGNTVITKSNGATLTLNDKGDALKPVATTPATGTTSGTAPVAGTTPGTAPATATTPGSAPTPAGGTS